MNFKQFKMWAQKHHNDILTALSLVGLGVTAYTSYKAGEKDICTYEEYSINPDTDRKSLTRDLVINKIPMICAAGSTAGLILFNHRYNAKEKAAMLAGLSVMSNALSDFQQQVCDRYSAQDMHEITKEVYDRNPNLVQVVDSLEYVNFGCLASESIDLKDGYLFFMSKEVTGTEDIWFRSTMLAVTAAEYYTNRNYVMNGEAYLSDFLGFLGLAVDDIYDRIGWRQSVFDDDVWWLDFNHNHVGERGSEEAFYEIIFSARPSDLCIEEEN